jgi:hypothetical protein
VPLDNEYKVDEGPVQSTYSNFAHGWVKSAFDELEFSAEYSG